MLVVVNDNRGQFALTSLFYSSQDDATDGDSGCKLKQQQTPQETELGGETDCPPMETVTTATLLQHLLATATQPLPIKAIFQYELEVCALMPYST